MSEESDDKQFDPTEQKLRKAREEGDIPRSTELGSALVYLGFWGAIAGLGAYAVPRWLAMAARALGAEPWVNAEGRSVGDLGRALAGYAALVTLGAVAIMGVAVLAGLIVQRGFVFTPKKLAPDFSRVNPMKTMKQKFGKSGIVTFAISFAKVVFVAAGGVMLYRSLLVLLVDAGFMRESQWISGLGLTLRRVALLALGISVAFAGLDLLWKHLDFRRRNRMSRKETTDEHKESEGDPHFKAARRQKGVDIVMSRMLADVEKADVVIVNPTHYAVALEWKRGSGRAPVCLAKGVDDVARRIRERAGEHGVPIWPDPPCARMLHASLEIGDEIQPDHFAAVAAAIRFAEVMRKKAREVWGPPKKKGKS